MPHCLLSVLWLEFSVWESSDKLTTQNKQSCSHQSCCFFNNGTMWGVLADNLTSHRHPVIVTILTGNFRPYWSPWSWSLESSSSIHLNGSFPIFSQTFWLWLPHEGIWDHFSWTAYLVLHFFICFPLTNQLFNQSTLFFWISGRTQEMHYNQHVQMAAAWVSTTQACLLSYSCSSTNQTNSVNYLHMTCCKS